MNNHTEVFNMVFCKKCGTQLEDNAAFCPKCGESAGNTASSNAGQNTQSDSSTSYANEAYQNAKSKVETVLNTKDATNEYDNQDIENNKVICALAYIPILFFLPLIACPKDSKFAKFHANQGLLFFILSILVGIVCFIIGHIPVFGLIVNILLGVIMLGMFLFGLINTLQGKAKELPLIGGIRMI